MCSLIFGSPAMQKSRPATAGPAGLGSLSLLTGSFVMSAAVMAARCTRLD